ncbi:MAG: putative glycosyl transferase [Frankiales bacterium]|nr:putative glycosyl transferase [Frankiales bacterium]
MVSVEAHIVSYNSRDLIGACLDSLYKFKPTDRDIEFSIALLDNASPDGSGEFVAQSYPDVRLIQQATNTWYGPASNRLVETSTADFILVINPDTEIEQDVVSPLLAALTAEPDAVLAYPQILDVDHIVQPSTQKLPTLGFELAMLLRGTKVAKLLSPWWHAGDVVRRHRDEKPVAGRAIPIGFVWSTGWLIRREAALRFPFSPQFPMYDTDVDISRRMSDAGATAVYVDSASIVHIGGASSAPERKRRMERDSRAAYYRIYHGRLYSQAYLAVHWAGVRKRRKA